MSTYYSAKFSQKLHENEKIRPRVAFKILLSRSATASPFFNESDIWYFILLARSSHPVAPTKTSPTPSLIRWEFVTARKRSFQGLFFHRCLSVHRGRGSPWQTLPGQRPFLDGEPPLDRDHPLYGNERAVRILLECIFVYLAVVMWKHDACLPFVRSSLHNIIFYILFWYKETRNPLSVYWTNKRTEAVTWPFSGPRVMFAISHLSPWILHPSS